MSTTKRRCSRNSTNNNIRLRALEPEDIDTLYAWENDTELWQLGASIAPFSRFVIKEYLIDSKQDIFQNKQLRLMIELKENDIAIGTIDLYDFEPLHRRAGIGILIDKKYRRQGFGFQTLALICEYCFEFLKMNQLFAFIPEQNQNSIALFEKADFQKSGALKEWLSSENGFENVVIMQKINLSK
jgi:diamine N-acetyltransferase